MGQGDVQIDILELNHQTALFKAYDKVFSSRAEVEVFYGRFLENGWFSGAWKDGDLVGVLSWAPREAVRNGLAEIVDLWVKPKMRRIGIGAKLIDYSVAQMKQYYERFGATLRKVMLFTGASERFIAARKLYEKKGFRVVAAIPRGALDNPDEEDLLYVVQI